MLKLGLALGGALIGWMLAGGGYDAAAKKRKTAPRQHHHRSVHYRPGHLCYLLSAAIGSTTTPEKPVPPKSRSGATGAGRTPQRTEFTAKNCKTKGTDYEN